jgi:predicted nucleic acid-binding protein
VSALIQPRGPSGLVVEALIHGKLDVSSTDHLWSELQRALSYPHF